MSARLFICAGLAAGMLAGPAYSQELIRPVPKRPSTVARPVTRRPAATPTPKPTGKAVSEWILKGKVTGVTVPTFVLHNGTLPYTIVVQDSTICKMQPGRARGAEGLMPGDSVWVEGMRLDDGRILAIRMTLLKEGEPVSWTPQTPGLHITNLSNGAPVPTQFSVQGKTVPGSFVRVVMRSYQPLKTGEVPRPPELFTLDARADGSGRFDIPMRADTEPPGSRLELEIRAGDPSGNRVGPVTVELIRQ